MLKWDAVGGIVGLGSVAQHSREPDVGEPHVLDVLEGLLVEVIELT